jgi:CheY-like chemotaxis protein
MKSLNILMADDDPDDRMLMTVAIREAKLPHKLQFAIDGEELIEMLCKKVSMNEPLPDLVILDLNMPRKDGLSALKEIKNDPSLALVKIVVFSTSNSERDRINSLNSGAAEYRVKPYNFTELVDLVKDLCATA